ncbi:ribosome small subunit-dependent GTPase A [Streptomyces sp. H27-S2]|uniref:ribosome small subunit-dependent GTPase A n=1 Tax=Streptomyces antarcticus TaxID=2996458 RepID=UPI002271ACB7|nr:ribosome small subunit-dependent GTPase A [Streptomyces sp. H27-S2]MCY0952969.1 ribosome small subunit-dependent GTPase A [Streptomyces sp. H27-S2]
MTDTLTAPAALERLGWNAADEDRWTGPGAPARVVVNHGSVCEVLLGAADGRLVQHSATTAPQLPATPVAGDWVGLGADGRIRAVAARRAVLSRAGAAGSGPQVLAANIDTVLMVVPLDGGLNAKMVERLSVMGWESGAQPVLVLSKSDRTRDEGAEDAAAAELLSPGVPVVPVSVRTGQGLDTLRTWLGPGTTAVMLGPSGAGKTSLLNALEGTHEAVTEVGRAGGRHTTTTRRLHLLASGGVLLDIPGIRSLEVAASRESVDDVFADLAAFALGCQFGDCGHDGDGGCAVEEAVRTGDLPSARLANWRKLQGEIAYRERREDPSAMADIRRQWKAVSKQARRGRRG